MRAIDVMTSQVVTAAPQMTVQDAAKLMINNRISGIPIVDGDRQLVGIVTEGDFCCAGPKPAPSGSTRAGVSGSRRIPVWPPRTSSPTPDEFGDIMTREVDSVGEFPTLGEIANLMETRRIKRVPVVHDGKLVGIVSRADLLKVLASNGPNPPDEERDRSIRSRLFAELRNQTWSRLNELDIVVSDGVVQFWGVVGSEEERRRCALPFRAPWTRRCGSSRRMSTSASDCRSPVPASEARPPRVRRAGLTHHSKHWRGVNRGGMWPIGQGRPGVAGALGLKLPRAAEPNAAGVAGVSPPAVGAPS